MGGVGGGSVTKPTHAYVARWPDGTDYWMASCEGFDRVGLAATVARAILDGAVVERVTLEEARPKALGPNSGTNPNVAQEFPVLVVTSDGDVSEAHDDEDLERTLREQRLPGMEASVLPLRFIMESGVVWEEEA